MGVELEGFGSDWLVTRRQGGRPELTQFASLAELNLAVKRLLLRAETHAAPSPLSPHEPVVMPMVDIVTRPAIVSPLGRSGGSPFAPKPAPVNGKRLPVQSIAPKPVQPKQKPKLTVADCQACGACCAVEASSGVHARLDEEDAKAIPIGFQSLIVETDRGKFLGVKTSGNGVEVCTALKGSIGNQCRCIIYDQRPMVCRLFEPGSSECLSARKRLFVGVN